MSKGAATAGPVFRFTSEGPTAKDRTVTEFELINWRSDRRAFFLRNQLGAEVVARPELPKLAENWRFPEPPFPECAAVAVRPYRLIPPPVRWSAKDNSGRTVRNRIPAGGWEEKYDLILAADDADKPALRALLKQVNDGRKKQFEQRTMEAAAWNREDRQDLTDAAYKAFAHHENRAATLLGLDKPFTMDDLRQDVGGWLTGYLHDQWAKQQGFDLSQMGWQPTTVRL